MRNAWVWLLIIALMLAVAVGAWLQMPPAHTPGFNDIAAGNDRGSRASHDSPDFIPAPGANSAGPVRTEKTGPAPEPDIIPPPSEDASWRVKGRIVSIMLDGLDLLPQLTRNGFDLHLQMMDMSDEGPRTDDAYLYPDTDGTFDHESGWQISSMPKPAEQRWCIHIDNGFGPSPIDQFVEAWDAAEEGPKPDPAKLSGLIKPTVKGDALDFGNLRIDLGLYANPPQVLIGRLLVPGGLPLVSRQALQLHTPEESDPEIYLEGNVNSQGRFALVVSADEFEEEEGKQGTTDLALLTWLLELSKSSSEWLSMGYGMQRGDTDPRPSLTLNPPQRRGRLIDFGDIQLDGAVLEIQAEVAGYTPPATTGDPLTRNEDVPWPPHASLHLNCGNDDLYVDVEIGLMLRVLLPEARYTWSAELVNPEMPARPQVGSVAARQGKVAQLRVTFQPAKLIPIRVVAPEGVSPKDLDANWTIALGEDDWWDGDATSTLQVPILPGHETEVSGKLPGYQSVSATVKDAEEVVLTFERTVPLRSKLVVVLPLAPPGVGNQLGALLYLRSENDTVTRDAPLRHDKQQEIALDDLDACEFSLVLRGGACFGYPGSVLSALESITLVEGQTQRVELPEIAAPPWAKPVGMLVLDLSIGGESASLYALWEFNSGESRYHSLSDGDKMFATRNASETSTGSWPVALLYDDTRLPLKLELPAEPWGEGRVSLDLPVRLNLSVTRLGQPVPNFDAAVQISNPRVVCQVAGRDGRALLWSPPGTYTLGVEINGNEVHRQAVEMPASGTLELTVELSAIQLHVRAAEGDEDGDLAWILYRLPGRDELDTFFGSESFYLPPGRYRLAPREPADQSAAFEFEMVAGTDREITLPRVTAIEFTNLLLAMAESDWPGLEYCNLRYLFPVDGSGGNPQFAQRAHDIDIRNAPDGLLLQGLPVGRRVLIHGFIQRNVDGKSQSWVMKPLDITVQKDGKLDPHWRKASSLDYEWDELDLFCVSDFPGFWVWFGVDMVVAPGRHELVILDDERKEFLRVWVDIPADSKDVPIPPELRRKLEAAKLLEPPEPEEPGDPTED